MTRPREFYQGISIALLLAIFTVLLAVYAFRQLEISTLSRTDTQLVLRDANRLISSLKDAEIGQRSFLMTGDRAFLGPYNTAMVNIPIDLAKLARRRESTLTPASLDDLQTLVAAKILELTKIQALAQMGDTDDALAVLKAGTDLALMGTIRSRLNTFVDVQRARLDELDKKLKNYLERLFLFIIAAGTIWMLFLLGFIHLLHRRFEERVSFKVRSQLHLETLDLLNAQTESVVKLERANLALKDSNVLVETVLNSVADCVVRVRVTDGVIEYANLATEKLFGFVDRTLEGKPLTLILPNLKTDVYEFLRGENEVMGRCSDGKELILKMYSRPMKLSEIEYNICTLRDFTARKRIESLLRTTELNLHNGIAVAGLGLAVIDYVKNEVTLDEAAGVLFDLPHGTAISRNAVHGRFHPGDAAVILAHIDEALDPSGLGFMALEHRVVARDGTVRWLSARKQVLFASNAKGRNGPVSGTLAVRDITSLKSTLLELSLAKEAAETANLAKSRFLSNMSHELRTPLNAILGFAQLMATGTPLPSPKQQKSIDQILQAGWYLLELINEVLDLALIESGKLTLSPTPTDLVSILSECQEMMEPLGKSRDVLLVFRIPETRYLLNADRTRLKQVLLNLLSNAIKYNRKGGTVLVSCATMNYDTLRISVADTGEGLAPENLEQLFQPFNRLGQESFSEEGTGIGLVLSKRLIELMGGAIGAESTVGVGSHFWIDVRLEMQTPLLLQDGAITSSPGSYEFTNSMKEAP